MSEKVEIAPRTRTFPDTESTVTAGGMLAPDTSLYTRFYPTASKASYAAFGAPLPSLGGSLPFSYNVLLRFQSFGAGVTSGYVTGQDVLQLIGGGTTGSGGVSVSYERRGFFLYVRYQNLSFLVLDDLRPDRWYDITFTWDGTNSSVYLDGGLSSTYKMSMQQLASPALTLGLNVTDPPPRPPQGETNGSFVGDVKRVFVWKSCLSASDVAKQTWTLPGQPVQSGSLVLGYDFTANPPARVGSGPTITKVNLGYGSESPALFSWGDEVAAAGQGTQAKPGGGAPFSILAWINAGNPARVAPKLDGYIFSNGAATDPNHIGIRLAGGKVVAEFGSKTVTSSATLAGNQWYYLGVTYDGATCCIYLNNDQVASGSISGVGTPSASAIRLFGILNGGNPASTWQGYIQFLSIWNKALTAAQVAQQAKEDPTLDLSCTANFMLSAPPMVDSIAVRRYGLWDADQVQTGQKMFIDSNTQYLSAQSVGLTEPRRPGLHRVSEESPELRLTSGPWQPDPATVEPFSPEHRAMMVDELKAALSSIAPGEHVDRLLEEYREEVERVFTAAAGSSKPLAGPRVSYREVDGQIGLFYHPDEHTEIDLQVRVDITQECTIWWANFILTAFLGLLGIFGIPTPMDALTALARRIVADPAVIQALQTVVGLTFTAGTLLAFCKVLYDFGYLSQALWMAVSKLSWWGASKFIIYVMGIFAPVVSPQKALFIANAIVTVGGMVQQLLRYPTACGSSVPELRAA